MARNSHEGPHRLGALPSLLRVLLHSAGQAGLPDRSSWAGAEGRGGALGQRPAACRNKPSEGGVHPRAGCQSNWTFHCVRQRAPTSSERSWAECPPLLALPGPAEATSRGHCLSFSDKHVRHGLSAVSPCQTARELPTPQTTPQAPRGTDLPVK